ncbi:hypothetical protein OIU91_04105 [Streptomyces sp. NBC_01456]|uniref:hypothetical protein n=1 Tax=unclassified Streptomyces TaxID=2593676 RepID=UPI002E332E89|nr:MULTISPECIES: hypothetical protein [unclassified Streptomyces]
MRVLPRRTCTTGGCRARATHILETTDDNPIADNVRRVHDLVCEECGNSYMRTNWVKRCRPYLARNGAIVSVAPPRIRIRVQHENEPDAYTIEDWVDKGAAAIRAGRLVPYVIDIIDGAGNILNGCPNRLAGPGFEGTYRRPAEIQEAWLAYHAADHWTPCFGIQSGDLVTFGGENLLAVNYVQVDQDYGNIGANSGFILCQPIRTTTVRLRVWVEDLTRVLEITA